MAATEKADLSRITLIPGQCSGQPCLRGLRVTVWDVLDMLASGMTEEEILRDYPYLEKADFPAVYAYASQTGRERLSVEIIADLLKDRVAEGRELIKLYTQAGIVFLGINAALATLAFKDPTAGYAWLFESIGLATAVFFIVLNALEARARSPLEADVVSLNERLGKPLQAVGFPYLTYLARGAMIWSILAGVGWIVALFRHP